MAKKKSAFERWYESYKGQRTVGIVYSAGAAVVILGALFKIQHYPGASWMLNLGMGTEVILFLIGVFEKPTTQFHWEEVFPQLIDPSSVDEEKAEKVKKITRPNMNAMGGGFMAPSRFGAANPMQPTQSQQVPGQQPQGPKTEVPSLAEDDMKALKEGIAGLAKTATQFTELGKVAQASASLSEKMAAAEAATNNYVEASNVLAQNYAYVSNEMQQVAMQTQVYRQNVEQADRTVAALNSVYELELEVANAHVEAARAQVEAANAQIETAKAQVETQKTAVAATKQAAESQIAFAKEAAEAQAAFAQGAQLLQKQVADLNAVYGNMLNALN